MVCWATQRSSGFDLARIIDGVEIFAREKCSGDSGVAELVNGILQMIFSTPGCAGHQKTASNRSQSFAGPLFAKV
jgi:hypothetical protein